MLWCHYVVVSVMFMEGLRFQAFFSRRGHLSSHDASALEVSLGGKV